MAYHDDLIQQALMLVHKEPRKPKQASLRRAVSTAYYALFHLLIDASVANWKTAKLRHGLARSFEHTHMKEASKRFQQPNAPQYTGQSAPVVTTLRDIATTFVQLQEKRHIADYDNATFWTRTEALLHVAQVQKAFQLWETIRDEPLAQEYLLALLAKKRT